MVPGFPGSSPLTRGKRVPRYRRDRDGGLIPAHAGKTSRQKRSPHGDRAHPRSRGENRPISSQAPSATGSSPLTRGKPLEGLAGLLSGRLIPAHAGKTRVWEGRSRRGRAHPRSRGENGLWELIGFSDQGSSPLTRGKRSYALSALILPWLIPAHAGKTHHRRRFGRCWQAHPRSRGENGQRIDVAQPRVGSSPLTRGKLPWRTADRQ